MTDAAKTKRKITVCICACYFVLFLLSAFGMTKWKENDLNESMFRDFDYESRILSIRSLQDDFPD